MDYLIILGIIGAMLYLFCNDPQQKAAVSVTIIFIICAVGFGRNIVKWASYDFKPPYKEEIIRGIGIVIPPVGVAMGYLDIEGDQ
jgi:hypothetical protein